MKKQPVTDRCSLGSRCPSKSRRRLSEKWSRRVHRYSDITRHGIRRPKRRRRRRKTDEEHTEASSKTDECQNSWTRNSCSRTLVVLRWLWSISCRQALGSIVNKFLCLRSDWIKILALPEKLDRDSLPLLLKSFNGGPIECCLVIIFYRDDRE